MRHGLVGIVAMGVLLSACHDGDQIREQTAGGAAFISEAASLSASCSGCHAVSGGAIADLSNYTEAQLLISLKGYRDDPDGSSVMHRLARGYTEAEIEAIAAYLGARDE